MECNHEKLRCTNNQFFCLICGQQIQEKPQEKPQEKKPEEDKPAKKTTRKGKQA